MKKISLNNDGTYQHQWLEGIHNIPESAIDVDDDVFVVLSQNPTTKKYDPITKIVSEYVRQFVADNAVIDAYMRIETDRNNAIVCSITSNALGSPHTYSTKPENRQFLNDLITLGNGGKFTCTDADDVKARRPHSHAQLLSLAGDIEARISAQFDHYELKLPEIAAVAALPAPTQADFDAIVW